MRLMKDHASSSNEQHAIFLIEDEVGIAQTITIQLQLVGFRVYHAVNAEQALASEYPEICQAIILDWMLPDIQGPDLIPELRKRTLAPILMLTARSELVDKLVGLEAGADDYLTKPFDMMELIARIKALIRRRQIDTQSFGEERQVWQYGALTFNRTTRQVRLNERPIRLTPTELRLLEILIRQPGKVFTRDALIKEVLGYEYEGYGRTLDSHIARLRSKIESDPRQPRYIITVFGIGYKFGKEE